MSHPAAQVAPQDAQGDDASCPRIGTHAERGEQKYAQVLAGAREVFIASGFEGASVDDIARTAGISKATLYRHFPDKEALFIAVISQECQRQAAKHPELCHLGQTIDTFLLDLARDFLDFSLSDFGQGIYRVAVAESERFPNIGETFYATSFERNRRRLAPALTAAMERGELMTEDAGFAANTFFAICIADIFHRGLFGIAPTPTQDQIDTHARRAVATFLRAFGFRGEPFTA